MIRLWTLLFAVCLTCTLQLATRCNAQGNITLTCVPGQNYVYLSWTGPTYLSGSLYQITRQTPDNQLTTLPPVSVTSSNFTDGGLTPGTQYRYQITEYDGLSNIIAQSAVEYIQTATGSSGTVTVNVNENTISGSGIDSFRSATTSGGVYGVFDHFLPGVPAVIGPGMAAQADFWRRQIAQADANIPRLINQLKDMGAAYLVFTLGQGNDWYNSPNTTYDGYAGYPYSQAGGIDYGLDLANACKNANIKFFLYIPSNPPPFPAGTDGTLASAFNYTQGPFKNADFQNKWQQVITEYSQRYGSLVYGWFVDGCYWPRSMYNRPDGPNFATLAAALRSGNPNAIITFNDGGGPTHPMTQYENYTAGEWPVGANASLNWTNPNFPQCTGRYVAGTDYEKTPFRDVWHVNTFLGYTFGVDFSQVPGYMDPNKTRFTDTQLEGWAEPTLAKGGCITFDVPVDRNNYPGSAGGIDPDTGTFYTPFVNQLSHLNAAVNSTSYHPDGNANTAGPYPVDQSVFEQGELAIGIPYKSSEGTFLSVVSENGENQWGQINYDTTGEMNWLNGQLHTSSSISSYAFTSPIPEPSAKGDPWQIELNAQGQLIITDLYNLKRIYSTEPVPLPDGTLYCAYLQPDGNLTVRAAPNPASNTVSFLEYGPVQDIDTGEPGVEENTNSLWAGYKLYPGDELTSDNGEYVLQYSGGGIIIYDQLYGGFTVVATPPGGYTKQNASFVMQPDGNLVYYVGSGGPVWQSGSQQPGPYNYNTVCQLDNNGDLIVFQAPNGDYNPSDYVPVWDLMHKYSAQKWQLYQGQRLNIGQTIASQNGQYTLNFQGTDGNIVLYGPSGGIVDTGPAPGGPDPGAYLAMQYDGNLVYYSRGVAVWQSNTAGRGSGPYVLSVSDSGNLVITANGTPIWVSPG